MSFKLIPKTHNNCQVVMLDRLFKNRLYPVCGLYCEDHGIWIKWLTNTEAIELSDFGVEKLDMIPEEQDILQRLQTNSQNT